MESNVTNEDQSQNLQSLSNVKDKNEFVDYSVPSSVHHGFTDEELEKIFNIQPEVTSEEIKTPQCAESLEALLKSIISVGVLPSAYKSTGNETLDFFFQILDRFRKGGPTELLAKSWEKEALNSLKLIAYLRDCRHGKGIRKYYQYCLYWLYVNHPKTLANNLQHLASFGYWKDLLHLLTTIFFYGEVPHYLDADDSPSTKSKSKIRRQVQLAEIQTKCDLLKNNTSNPNQVLFPGCKTKRSAKAQLVAQRWNALNTRVFNNLLLANIHKMDPTFKLTVPNFEFLPKKERRELTHKFARFRLENDLKYRYFHKRIAQIFAEQLQKDKKTITEGNATKDGKRCTISLAGKWAPSVSNHFDKYTLIATTIAQELVSLENLDLKMEKNFESVKAFLARKAYNKEYLVPLREYLSLPENLISTQNWSRLDYSKVPSLCLQRYAELFAKHDAERFDSFVSKKKKSTGSAKSAIEIINTMMQLTKEERDTKADMEELEKEWLSLVSEMKAGKKSTKTLSSALTICDTSSLSKEPLTAALSLTLLALDLTESPWNEMCITYHEEPDIIKIQHSDKLFDKYWSFLANSKQGQRLDFDKTFELILKLATDTKAKTVPKTLIIFASIDFVEAFPGVKQASFESINSQFTKAGYEMPKMIFWNLREDKENPSAPIMKDEFGTIRLNGYSRQLMNLVKENQDLDKFEPLQMMSSAIGHKSYDALKVFD